MLAPLPTRPTRPAPPGPLHGQHLLLVEDNELSRIYLRLLVEGWGGTLTEAASGPAAVALLNAHAYHAVLLDLQLPGFNGIAVAQHLRRHPDAARAATPALALSAEPHPAALPGFAGAGFAACLTKPFQENDLLRALVALGAGPPPAAPYNLAPLHAVAQGRPQFVARLLRSFVAHMPASLAALQAAAAAGHWAEAASLAHHIKPNLLALNVAGTTPALDVLLDPPTAAQTAPYFAALATVVRLTEAALVQARRELSA